MTTVEDRLRAATRAAAATVADDSAPPLTLPGRGTARAPRRRRPHGRGIVWMAPAAAAVAVAAVAIGLTAAPRPTTPAAPSGPARPGRPAAAQPPLLVEGLPAYFLDLPGHDVVSGGATGAVREALHIVSARTGKVAATVTVPGSVYRIAADSTGNGTERFYAAVITQQGPVRFYRITRPAGGTAATVTALPIPATSGTISYLAVSPDGRQLAWTTDVAHGSTSYVQGVTVASTVTGTERRWAAPRDSAGSVASLSWLGDNRTLAFSWAFSDNSPAGSLRLLDTTAAGTHLLSGRSVLALSNRAGRFADLVISRDGQVLVGALSYPRGPFGTVAGQRTALGDVIQFAARTGRARFLYRPHPNPGRAETNFCDDPLWMGYDGRGVLLACDRSAPHEEDHVSVFLLGGGQPVPFPQLVPFVKAQDELVFSG